MENKQELAVIGEVENEEFYKPFLENSKSSLAEYTSVADQIKKLSEGIDLVTSNLQKQVLEKHEDLLKQAHHATKLENVLNAMNEHVQNLFANAERLKNQINTPYETLEHHTRVLGRLHLASHILRQVNRIQHLSKRLAHTNDPAQKASILQELEQLALDEELKDVDAVTLELRHIRSQQQKIISLAIGYLNQGIINENVTQATTALQIFTNLGTITQVTQDLIKASLDECKESLRAAFDAGSAKTKSAGSQITLNAMQGFRTKIWSELEKTFGEQIFQQCKQIKFLQVTLNNITFPNVNDNLAANFWNSLGSLIELEIRNSTPAVKQMLEDDYPKLLKCYYEVSKKMNYNQFVFNHSVLEKCENSYLHTSLTQLLDPTEAMFTNNLTNVPSHDDIDKVIRIITNNLSVALIETTLSGKIGSNVSKCIKMFAVKTEQQLDTGPDSAQVIGGSQNSGQQKNVNLANATFYFFNQIQRILFNMKESLSSSKIEVIVETLEELNTLTGNIIQPLIVSINSAVETILITIHLENDWDKLKVNNTKVVSCSPYMRELNEFITRVYNTYLCNFENKEVLSEKCKEIVERTVELFIRHSSIIRPLSQAGRLRLQVDYAQLENTLKLLNPDLPNLGKTYKLLKSMASLITLSPTEIIESHTAYSVVPHSTVLFMLFSFADKKFASPHQNIGWSPANLSNWLDEHKKERERLDLIAGAIQRYEVNVRESNTDTYDPMYPIISQFLANALKSVN